MVHQTPFQNQMYDPMIFRRHPIYANRYAPNDAPIRRADLAVIQFFYDTQHVAPFGGDIQSQSTPAISGCKAVC